MSPIRKVAVVGASGNVGVPVTAALLEAGFDVTVITGHESTSTFPAGVTVKRVDYRIHKAVNALTDAFRGQDAVVSAAATEAAGSQKVIIDAAVAAHVKRFIPSEFGINTQEARGTKIGALLQQKVDNVEYLAELSKKHDWFTWTDLSTGSFIDWSLKVGMFGIDFKNKTAKIFDSGNELYSPSSLPFVGKSVAAILKNPDETANKYLTVASFTTSQREILKIIEEETGDKFQIIPVKTSDLEKIGDEKLAKGDYSAFVEYLIHHVFGDGAKGTIKDNATKMLGLEEEDLRTVIKKVLSEL